MKVQRYDPKCRLASGEVLLLDLFSIRLCSGLPGMEALATSMMKKEMEKIDMPDVHEFLDILVASGVKLWACKLAMDMFHYKKEDMYADIHGVITVGDFYKQGSGLGTHMLFI